MQQIISSSERGLTQNQWLKSYHSFSFADYYHPQKMGYESLRVMNEDFIQPQSGFPMHSHHNMDILTLVLSGTLEHQDSLGHTSQVTKDQIQLMTAGSGIQHSEKNPSPTEAVHLYQIWIKPSQINLEPNYQTVNLDTHFFNESILLASPHQHQNTLVIHQNVSIYLLHLNKNHPFTLKLISKCKYYFQIAAGSLLINQNKLHAGDAITLESTNQLNLNPQEKTQILYFEFE